VSVEKNGTSKVGRRPGGGDEGEGGGSTKKRRKGVEGPRQKRQDGWETSEEKTGCEERGGV